MIRKLEEIYQYKNTDVAVLLGSGSSINNITEKQWRIISRLDTWTVNNWLYHPFVPKFYHVEVKKYNSQLWKQRKKERKDDFKDTMFIINKDRKNHLLSLIGSQKYIFEYQMNKINITKDSIVPGYRPSSDPNVLICNLNASLTMILELLCRFKYEKVIFFGVDLKDSRYFWTGNPDFGEVHCQTCKDREGIKPDEPHSIAHTKNFIVWFSKERMKEIGGEFFVGHKDTFLYPDLKLINMETI